MDIATYQTLCQLNNRFYAAHHVSFASTRHNFQPGWTRVLACFANRFGLGVEPTRQGGFDTTGTSRAECGVSDGGLVRGTATTTAANLPAHKGLQAESAIASVLDVACGTMRFGRCLNAYLPSVDLDYRGIDGSADLVQGYLDDNPENTQVRFKQEDLLGGLPNASPFPLFWDEPGDLDGAFNLATCFGFMHHIPGHANRIKFLKRMLPCVAPQGLLAVSFWCFAQDEGFEVRAQRDTAGYLTAHPLELELEDNDYLLSWDGNPDVVRYCHSFTEAEADDIIQALGMQDRVVDRFTADGKTKHGDIYLIFQ